MVEQSPRLLIILRSTSNIITSCIHPHCPTSLPLWHQLAQASRIGAVVRGISIVVTEFCQNDGHLVHCCGPSRAESCVPEAAFDLVASGGGVLVVVEFEDHFVAVGEVGEEEFLAVAEVFAAWDGVELGVEVEAGEEDEDVGVGFVDAAGCVGHLVVPDWPGVWEGGARVVGLAKFVAKTDGDEVRPFFTLQSEVR